MTLTNGSSRSGDRSATSGRSASQPARRIALVASSYFPHLGGVEEHTRRVAAGSAARGYDVEIWTVRRDDLPPLEEVEGITVRRLPAPLPTSSARGAASFLADVGPAALEWRRAVRAFRPELLHVQCFGPNGVYGDAVSRLTGVPLVVSLHGETFMDDHDAFTHSRILRGGLRRAMRRARAVSGCSQVVLDDAVRRFGLPSGTGHVVFNGVDPRERPDPTGPESWNPPFERYVLGLGRLVRNKGFDLLIDAFAQLSDRHPDLGLIIAGDGPERSRLQTQIARTGRPDRIALPGRASRADVARTMAGADLLVMPSRVEPFGIVVLEAWRAGLAVIASNRGGAPEFVHDGEDGVLVDPLDSAALANAIDRLSGDEMARKKLGTAALNRVSQFGIARVVDQYEEIYRSIIPERKSQVRS